MLTNQSSHQKHTKIPKPALGKFGRIEWAILGTKCNIIKELSYRIIEHLASFKVAYIDADHRSGDEPLTEYSAITAGGSMDVTDAIHYLNIKHREYPNRYDLKHLMYDKDLILINGNHFQASRQIIILDPNKKESLKKRLDQLTDVRAIIQLDGSETFDFLYERIPDIESIPILKYGDVDQIVQFIQADLESQIPKIKGLVLAGGKSKRMGHDKGMINYHGMPQRDYLFQLLQEQLNIPSFVSVRPDQAHDISHPTIEDQLTGMGPFGAIVSAFLQDPNHAWLVVACDLPYLNKQVIDYLIENRNPSADATCFQNEATGFPDPLITIFEPKIYPRFYDFLALGYTCPRKVLINSNSNVIEPKSSKWLRNVNTPEELSTFQNL